MQALTEKYNPIQIDDFVGLKTQKALLNRIAADPYRSAWLLVGDSGTGKTSIAFAFVKALKGELHHIPAARCTVEELEKTVYACHYASRGDRHVVLIDEANTMSAQAQKFLLSVLDPNQNMWPADTIFVLTANEVDAFEERDAKGGGAGRFMSRVRRINFAQPTLEEFAEYLERVWKLESGSTEDAPDFAAIAADANGNIRAGLMTLETELLAPGSFVAPAKAATAHFPTSNEGEKRVVTPALATSISVGDRDELKRRAVEMFAAGEQLGKIAAALHIPQSTIWRWTRKVV